MPKPKHVRLSDLRGFHRLANDATVGLTDLVETMHHTVARMPGVFGKAPAGRTTGVTGFVYRSVRSVTRLAGAGIDALFGVLAPMLRDRPSSDAREAVLAALNGVFGDFLAASGNSLAVAMAVRKDGIPVAITRAALGAAFPDPGRKVVVLVHGLCMSDLAWSREGHDHGAALARDLGYTPLYLHYNTGLHVSANGHELGNLLEALLREWPHPIDRFAMVGHSMGGLVARSACHHAAHEGHGWPARLTALAFLGTPHFGAPLERAGAMVDLLVGISPYTTPFARLGKIRSAGIKDLRYGYMHDEDWQVNPSAGVRDTPAPPLPDGVDCYAIAASKQARRNPSAARIRGDGLVPVSSALGQHPDASRDLAIPQGHRWVGYGMGHLDLLHRREVYERLRGWLSERRGSTG